MVTFAEASLLSCSAAPVGLPGKAGKVAVRVGAFQVSSMITLQHITTGRFREKVCKYVPFIYPLSINK